MFDFSSLFCGGGRSQKASDGAKKKDADANGGASGKGKGPMGKKGKRQSLHGSLPPEEQAKLDRLAAEQKAIEDYENDLQTLDDLKAEIARTRQEKLTHYDMIEDNKVRLRRQRDIILTLREQLVILDDSIDSLAVREQERVIMAERRNYRAKKLEELRDKVSPEMRSYVEQNRTVRRAEEMKRGMIWQLMLTLAKGHDDMTTKELKKGTQSAVEIVLVKLSKDETMIQWFDPKTKTPKGGIKTNQIRALLYGPNIKSARPDVFMRRGVLLNRFELSAISFTLIIKNGTIDFLGNAKEQMCTWYLGLQEVAFTQSKMLLIRSRFTMGLLMIEYLKRRMDGIALRNNITRAQVMLQAIRRYRLGENWEEMQRKARDFEIISESSSDSLWDTGDEEEVSDEWQDAPQLPEEDEDEEDIKQDGDKEAGDEEGKEEEEDDENQRHNKTAGSDNAKDAKPSTNQKTNGTNKADTSKSKASNNKKQLADNVSVASNSNGKQRRRKSIDDDRRSVLSVQSQATVRTRASRRSVPSNQLETGSVIKRSRGKDDVSVKDDATVNDTASVRLPIGRNASRRSVLSNGSNASNGGPIGAAVATSSVISRANRNRDRIARGDHELESDREDGNNKKRTKQDGKEKEKEKEKEKNKSKGREKQKDYKDDSEQNQVNSGAAEKDTKKKKDKKSK